MCAYIYCKVVKSTLAILDCLMWRAEKMVKTPQAAQFDSIWLEHSSASLLGGAARVTDAPSDGKHLLFEMNPI